MKTIGKKEHDFTTILILNPFQSINFIIFLPTSAYIENKFDNGGQKKETMAKRYTLIHAHEKNLN